MSSIYNYLKSIKYLQRVPLYSLAASPFYGLLVFSDATVQTTIPTMTPLFAILSVIALGFLCALFPPIFGGRR